MTGAVTLHVWQVPARRVPRALWRVARDPGRLRRLPSVDFAKLLGTGADRRFGPGRADATRWAAVVAWAREERFASTPVARDWQRLSSGYCQVDLEPLAAKGSWAGWTPTATADAREAEMVLALTHARLRPTRALNFWRAIESPAAAASQAAGLLAAFGIGEAPVGWQGTVTIWETSRHLVEFAYRHPDHVRAIERAPTERWYAEELFARFAVTRITGDRDLLGWTQTQRGAA